MWYFSFSCSLKLRLVISDRHWICLNIFFLILLFRGNFPLQASIFSRKKNVKHTILIQVICEWSANSPPVFLSRQWWRGDSSGRKGSADRTSPETSFCRRCGSGRMSESSSLFASHEFVVWAIVFILPLIDSQERRGDLPAAETAWSLSGLEQSQVHYGSSES